MALGHRLKQARLERGLTQERLAEMAGLDPTSGRKTIQVLESRDSKRSEYSWALAKALRKRVEWLMTGEGPEDEPDLVLPDTSQDDPPRFRQSVARHLEPMQPWDDSTPLDQDEVEIPLFKEIEISAGDGTAHQVQINGRKLRFSKATLRAAGVDPASAACATATGTSMERLIMDGSTIGIDRGRTQIKDGKIYAIDHAGYLRVKYIYRLPGGGLRLRSENHEEYPDETYPAGWESQIKVLGWVFWWSTLERW